MVMNFQETFSQQVGNCLPVFQKHQGSHIPWTWVFITILSRLISQLGTLMGHVSQFQCDGIVSWPSFSYDSISRTYEKKYIFIATTVCKARIHLHC